MTSADDPAAIAKRLMNGDRAALARAITIVESARGDHQSDASKLLEAVIDRAGGALRIGVTGPPGAGKSTLIDAFGSLLTSLGERVAVLAIDPSSQRTHGSILGDKTRMSALAVDPAAFIRPTPTSGALGGGARQTREATILCEAAGFSVVIVETVGVGQSETIVADMVDVFVVLMPPGAGDELQGIKKGLTEVADIVVVTKADGDLAGPAAHAARDLKSALRIVTARDDGWDVPVLAASALEGRGLDELWATIEAHRRWSESTGARDARRRDQQVRWLWSIVEERLGARFRAAPKVRALIGELEAAVAAGEAAPSAAANRLLAAFDH